MFYIFTTKFKINNIMKQIIKKIDDCLQCPNFTTCKEIKKLTAEQRFAIKTSAAYRGVLKTCPLPDFQPLKEDSTTIALKRIFNLLDAKELNIKSFNYKLWEICNEALK